MNTLGPKHCRSCGTRLENPEAPFCPYCGRIREGVKGAEIRSCVATSYCVMLADRTVIGPIPASTIISMIQAGTIQPDHPIVNMDTGKAFFPDEDPVIRFLVGLDNPSSALTPSPSSAFSGSSLSSKPYALGTQPLTLVLLLIATGIALFFLLRGI